MAATADASSHDDESIHVPEHLRSSFLHMAMPAGRCMLIGRPRYKYPIATVPPPPEVAPLIQAIRECDARPFRIISYEQETGDVFNSSFFRNKEHMDAWLTWLSDNALSEGSRFHEHVRRASTSSNDVPTQGTLLFASATDVLTDTRFGEYQVGMAINFSRQSALSVEAHADMCEIAASSDFEQRIASCMHEHGVDYFGRLAMIEQADASSSPPALITALRYGSADDAKRGTALVRAMCHDELERWFGNQHTSLLGTTTQVLEL